MATSHKFAPIRRVEVLVPGQKCLTSLESLENENQLELEKLGCRIGQKINQRCLVVLAGLCGGRGHNSCRVLAS